MTQHKQLYRSRDACAGGVCTGIASYCNVDPLVVRILFLVATCATAGLFLFVYVALWITLPKEPEPFLPVDVQPEAVCSEVKSCVVQPEPVQQESHFANERAGEPSVVGVKIALVVGTLLLFVGFGFLMSQLMVDMRWWQFWPLLFIILGIIRMVVPGSHNRIDEVSRGIACFFVGVFLLPMSLHVIGWQSIIAIFIGLWPLLCIAVGLFVLGCALKSAIVRMMAVMVFALFCVAGILWYAVPGPVSDIMVVTPYGRVYHLPAML